MLKNQQWYDIYGLIKNDEPSLESRFFGIKPSLYNLINMNPFCVSLEC